MTPTGLWICWRIKNRMDIEMDCATVADGNLDECLEMPGKQIKMSGKLSAGGLTR